MGDVVNLRRARKLKGRRLREAEAEESRLRFGRAKAQREHAAASAALERAKLDAHRLEEAPAGGPHQPS